MEGPSDQPTCLPDPLWETATRFRLGMRASADRDEGRALHTCRNTTQNGRVCGVVLEPDDLHPIHCPCGGGVCLRHGQLSRMVGRIAADHLEVAVKYEQRMPQLDKIVQGETQHARLDVCYHDPQNHQVLMDVRIASPCAGETAKVAASARRDGETCCRQERNKIARYGESVMPFILETGGRPGKMAREWVRSVISQTTQMGAPAILASQAWAAISSTLQRYIATQLRKAEGKL